MCLLLREALTVGKIALSEHFFSIEMTKLQARNRLEDELSSYCVVTEAPKTTFGKVRQRTPRKTVFISRGRFGREKGGHLPRNSHAVGRFVRRTRASSTASRTTCAWRCSWP